MTSIQRRLLRAAGVPLLAALAVTFPATARAAGVLVLSPGGHVTERQDRFIPATTATPAPALTPPTARTATAAQPAHRATAKRKPKPKPKKTVRSELSRLLRTHAITPAQYGAYSASFNRALAAERHLHGTRARELTAVTGNLHDIAAAGMFTPSRLPALFMTVDRNRQWWTTGNIPAANQYVEFSGSQLVWEYYPGQGIELQVLANFGKADGMYSAGPSQYGQMQALLAELIPLAVQRGGGPTWEYYFKFDGGKPPWTSAMSQGTAIEALTRAYKASTNPSYLQLAHQALAVFSVAPPVGVRVPTSRGARFVQYTFTPRTSILNAFLQSLIGLYDYAQASNDPLAEQLFAAGNAEAQAEVPRFDTGAWSLYQPGVEDTLSYHNLVTGFLQQLCTSTDASVYCTTAQHFTTYLSTPPTLRLLTSRLRKGKTGAISFSLSKYSRVGIVVVGPGGHTLFQTSASFGYGTRAFKVPAFKHKGNYTIRLAATDLAGNFDRIVGTIQVA